jgi:DNA modification methylase
MKTKILTGDVCAVLRSFEANSMDAAFCDPPYGLSFMGKAWDHGVPDAATWAAILRVLKPGAPLLAFGGTRTFHRLACAIEDGGFVLTDTLCWLHGQGFPKGHAQLKPAWEPITLAWKKGPRVLAIDAGRIGCAGGTKPTVDGRPGLSVNAFGNGLNNRRGVPVDGLGRWPANVILDSEAAEALDLQSGTLKNGGGNLNSPERTGIFGVRKTQIGGTQHAGDSGGASRFFYCAKASRKERNAGLEGMPAGPVAETAGRNHSLNSAMRMENGVATGPKANSSAAQNTHPTVKPLKLCEYLARLILPAERDTPRRLLVPFSGSGSECIGAKRAGWDEVTGIELSAEYVAIAKGRLQAA